MTSQRRLCIAFQDVQSLRMTCEACKASLNIPLADIRKPLTNCCPYCDKIWFQPSNSYANHVQQLVDSVRALKTNSKDASCKLDLEIDQPE